MSHARSPPPFFCYNYRCMFRYNPTRKRIRWRDARAIRKATGLPMNKAIIVVRRLEQHRIYDLLDDDRFITKHERRCMDPQCNCKDYHLIIGPRGVIQVPVWGGGWQPYDGWDDTLPRSNPIRRPGDTFHTKKEAQQFAEELRKLPIGKNSPCESKYFRSGRYCSCHRWEDPDKVTYFVKDAVPGLWQVIDLQGNQYGYQLAPGFLYKRTPRVWELVHEDGSSFGTVKTEWGPYGEACYSAKQYAASKVEEDHTIEHPDLEKIYGEHLEKQEELRDRYRLFESSPGWDDDEDDRFYELEMELKEKIEDFVSDLELRLIEGPGPDEPPPVVPDPDYKPPEPKPVPKPKPAPPKPKKRKKWFGIFSRRNPDDLYQWYHSAPYDAVEIIQQEGLRTGIEDRHHTKFAFDRQYAIPTQRDELNPIFLSKKPYDVFDSTFYVEIDDPELLRPDIQTLIQWGVDTANLRGKGDVMVWNFYEPYHDPSRAHKSGGGYYPGIPDELKPYVTETRNGGQWYITFQDLMTDPNIIDAAIRATGTAVYMEDIPPENLRLLDEDEIDQLLEED